MDDTLTNKESPLFNQVSRSLTFLMIIAKRLGYRMMNFHNNQSNGQNNFLQTCLAHWVFESSIANFVSKIIKNIYLHKIGVK